MAEQPDAGKKILRGVLALGILGALWYFVGKGDRAFEETAQALRGATSYRVDIAEAGGKSRRSISVSCPDRLRVVPDSGIEGAGSAEFVVIGKDHYGRVGQGRWIRVPESFVALPGLNLCPGPDTGGNPKDLAALLEWLARTGRVESTGTSNLGGVECRGWQAVRRGPQPDGAAPPQLAICIDEKTNLPVHMVAHGNVWTFSAWNEPVTIETPTLEPAPADATPQ